MKQEFMKVPEFLETYNISRTAFYRLAKANEIRLIKIGASTRISVADAQAWAASLTGGAA